MMDWKRRVLDEQASLEEADGGSDALPSPRSVLLAQQARRRSGGTQAGKRDAARTRPETHKPVTRTIRPAPHNKPFTLDRRPSVRRSRSPSPRQHGSHERDRHYDEPAETKAASVRTGEPSVQGALGALGALSATSLRATVVAAATLRRAPRADSPGMPVAEGTVVRVTLPVLENGESGAIWLAAAVVDAATAAVTTGFMCARDAGGVTSLADFRW